MSAERQLLLELADMLADILSKNEVRWDGRYLVGSEDAHDLLKRVREFCHENVTH
jgi:hypothetical protein